MNWLQVELVLDQTDPIPAEQALFLAGATSVELRDAADNPIFEPLPGTTPIWPQVVIRALFKGDTEPTTIRVAMAAAMGPDNLPDLRFRTIPERDWVAEWQQSQAPLKISGNFWICPPGADCPDPEAISIELEPGLAFGTGSHPTTALCLEWLAARPSFDEPLLDFGCGSGILSVAAAALGTRQILAVDIDRQALKATAANAEKNHVLSCIEIRQPDQIPPDSKFSRIVANILSGTLIELADLMKTMALQGTQIALSGILSHQVGEVSEAYNDWVEFGPTILRDDWALLTGTVKDI